MKTELKLDWCSHEAAKYAVEKWHYSRSMPPGKTIKVGVWENSLFIGALIFGQGSSLWLAHAYGLPRLSVCELVRVALNSHEMPVSKILSISLRLLKHAAPGIRLVVSFADQNENHHGGIYQASNWIYAGASVATPKWIENATGRIVHDRERNAMVGGVLQWGRKMKKRDKSEFTKVACKPKHRYLMPIDKAISKQINKLSKPYPKRVRSIDADAPGNQPDEGGSIPTRTLHTSEATE